MASQLNFGLSQPFPCSYLPGQQEQLLVSIESTPIAYEKLIQLGFRRSGQQIYRPHCPQCNACQALRIPVAEFTPSSAQKRVFKKNAHLHTLVKNTDQPEYYELYERYISQRHADGDMYPATEQQYHSFLADTGFPSRFIECKEGERLVAVAVTDVLDNGFSALYTFFDPDYETQSLGTFAILTQIRLAQQAGKDFLYMGYQIDECQKMNYKANFYPHQRLIDNRWRTFVKKTR